MAAKHLLRFLLIMESSEILSKLFAPFDADDVAFRPGYKTKNGFRVFLYLDKRSIRDRLDEVVGPFNWTAHYEPLNEGFVCHLKIRVDGEWHTREGVGAPAAAIDGQSNKIKSAATDAFRNAAAAWGFGRHLDNLPVVIWPGEVNNRDQWRRWENEQKLRQKIASLVQGQHSKASRHTVIEEPTSQQTSSQPGKVIDIETRPLSDEQISKLAAQYAKNGVLKVGEGYIVKVNPKISYRVTKTADGSACECERFRTANNPKFNCEHKRAVIMWVKNPIKPAALDELKLLVKDAIEAGLSDEEIDSTIARVCDGVFAVEELDDAQVAKALRSLGQKLELVRLKARVG